MLKRLLTAAIVAVALILGLAAPAVADPTFVPPKSTKDLAYYLRLRTEVAVLDDDDDAGFDRSDLIIPTDVVAWEGQTFTVALVAACAGDEVRAEAAVYGRIMSGTLQLWAKMALFEGTSCETHDRDGAANIDATTILVGAESFDELLHGTVFNNTESEEDQFDLIVRFHRFEPISYDLSNVPAMEMVGRIDVTDWEAVGPNERNWIGYWTQVVEEEKLELSTCAGDEVFVETVIPAEPLSTIRFLAHPKMTLFESSSCGTTGSRGEVEDTYLSPLAATFDSHTTTVTNPADPDDQATLVMQPRLRTYGGTSTPSTLSTVEQLMAQIGVAL
jgi:hypothetical protein